MKNTAIILGVVGIAIIAAGAWLALNWQTTKAPDNAVSEERRQQCNEFLMVATFPSGDAADLFMEQCLRGEPVLPEELPPSIEEEPTPGPSSSGGCAIAGCSQTICAEESEVDDIVTTCEWREEYACYASSRCERQSNGQCGWTETEEFMRCMDNAGESEPMLY